MTAASPTAAPPQNAPARLAAVVAAHPLWLALALTALVTAFRATGTVDSDTAWQLWIAGRIHAGAHLYRDIIETNPPLWFWMALPLDRIAALLHVRIEAVLVTAIGALVALALAATNRLLGQVAPVRRALLLGYCALALAAMPWMHVGQREQIVLIGSLPYCALIASRRERRTVSPLLAALIGVGAGLGFALKHYFLIVPAALDLWLLAAQRRAWRPLRSETVAIACVGLAYACAILAWAPDFLTRIVPLIHLAYGAFGAPSIAYLFGPFAIVGFAIVGFVAMQWRILAAGKAPFASALFISAIAFAACYLIQSKGWNYHVIPLIGCASMALAALIAEADEPSPLLHLLAPVLLTMPLVLAAEEQIHRLLPDADLRGAVAGLQPGDTLGFVGTETAIPWSVTLQNHYHYASRYNGFWMMSAIVRNEAHGNRDPGLVRLGRQIVSDTTTDFTCIPPKRIIISRPRAGEQSYDILPFFLRDPRFAELLSHYRVRSRTSLETYELVRPWLLPPPTSCRR